MSPARRDETERTYDVAGATLLPPLAGVHPVTRVGQPVEQSLEAVYFDTAGLDLTRHGATLRRRTGGEDAGWHLKLPREGDTRTELHEPLGPATRAVPEALLLPVRAQVRDRDLLPIARVTTRRLEYALVGDDGEVLAHLCDDRVRAERVHGGPAASEWREWEVELADAGDIEVLDAVEEALSSAGAARSTSTSKLVRALGDMAPQARSGPSRKELERGSIMQVVVAHLDEQLDRLHQQDARLRAGRPGSVHKLRIAARRLRSALKTYGPLMGPEPASAVAEELRWLGGSLSDARDAQVLREHLLQLVDTQPVELVLGPVVRRIDDELRAAEREGMEQAIQALESERYFRLLDALDELLEPEVFTSDAESPAREVLPRLLQRDAKRLRRRVRAVARAAPGHERDVALHEARKKAKRLRYAAESAVPVLGKRARRLAASVKRVQQALGAHQDTVMTRQVLREYGVRAYLGGENGFTFGRLHALEEARSEVARRDFEAAWRAVPGKDLARWVVR